MLNMTNKRTSLPRTRNPLSTVSIPPSASFWLWTLFCMYFDTVSCENHVEVHGRGCGANRKKKREQKKKHGTCICSWVMARDRSACLRGGEKARCKVPRTTCFPSTYLPTCTNRTCPFSNSFIPQFALPPAPKKTNQLEP